MSDLPDSTAPRPGCLTLGILFAAMAVGGWVLAILAYGLVIEQWGLIAVRREFSYEMGIFWAPLFGLFAGICAVVMAMRGERSRRTMGMWAGIALLAALALASLVVGLGTVF